MKDLTGFGFVVVVLIVTGFGLLGFAAYLDSTLTAEQICAKQTIVQSEYCKVLVEQKKENVR